MKPFTLDFHLLVPTVLSLMGLIFLVVRRKPFRNKRPLLYKAGLTFFFTYALLMGNALGHNMYYHMKLNSYDLNHNGQFDYPAEITKQQSLAMERLADNLHKNSTGRSALIVSCILAVAVYLLNKINMTLLEPDEHENKNKLNNIHIQ